MRTLRIVIFYLVPVTGATSWLFRVARSALDSAAASARSSCRRVGCGRRGVILQQLDLMSGALSTAMEMSALSPEIAGNIMRWVILSWIRCALDGLTAILLLGAAAQPETTS